MEAIKDTARFDKVMSAYLVLSGLLSDGDFVTSAVFTIVDSEPDIDEILIGGNSNGLDAVPFPHKFVRFTDSRAATFESALWNLVEDGRVPLDYRLALRTLSRGQLQIFPGEYDSFGWLSGILRTPLGMFVFG